MVIEAKKQGEKKLAEFLKHIAAWEIPILSIKSDGGPMVVYPGSEPSREQWASYRLLRFPDVQSTYVLEVDDEQRQAIEFLCQRLSWKVLS